MENMKFALIGPSFFGYIERLSQFFTERGTPAAFFDERPSNSVWGKIAVRFSPANTRSLLSSAHNKRHADTILSEGFTHVLLISPELFPLEQIQRFKDAGLTVCRYNWDSVENKRHFESLDPLIDRTGSFDSIDCATYGYEFIPLYSDAVLQTQPAKAAPERDTDMFYCATLHSKRPNYISKAIKICEKQDLSFHRMLFFHKKWLWFIRYFKTPAVWHLLAEISTKGFSRSQITTATQRAKVVLDIHHTGQSGMTMRTFEALSLGAVVLTTNQGCADALPEDLRERIVYFDLDTLDTALTQALIRPSGALSQELVYYLSVDRFLDQLHALLTNDIRPSI